MYVFCDKYMTVLGKVRKTIKTLKADKRFNTKESFPYFYIPVILFDSVYRKDRNNYAKVFLE